MEKILERRASCFSSTEIIAKLYVTEKEKGVACSTHGNDKKLVQFEGNRELEREGTVCGVTDWIQLA